jgi:5-methylcytosine-specific restriction protein A
MPGLVMPKLMCLVCKALSASSYCPAHTRKRKAHTLSGSARGYDYAWTKTAKAAILAQPWCSYCGSQSDLTGDHIVPKSKGGSNEPANVRVLCRSCNSRKKDST